MAQVKRKTSTKRFGTRYGRSLKDKLAPIEEASRRTYKCPYCSKLGVRRQAAGIWFCKKCNAKFASKAYTLTKKKIVKEEFEDTDKIEETRELPEEMVAIAQQDSEEDVSEEKTEEVPEELTEEGTEEEPEESEEENKEEPEEETEELSEEDKKEE